jgi:two-component system chemotaxis response regulator CheB
MEVKREGLRTVLQLHEGPPENSCRPAVDVLFRSVAATYGGNVLAVVLTGMGQDGLRGCQHLREAHAQVIAQDEKSSVVWGMPGCVATAGLADLVVPLDRVGGEIVRRVKESRRACAA